MATVFQGRESALVERERELSIGDVVCRLVGVYQQWVPVDGWMERPSHTPGWMDGWTRNRHER